MAGSPLFHSSRRRDSRSWIGCRRRAGRRHLTIPRYSEPDKTLYAVIRVDKVYTEYRKEGFFPHRRAARGGAGRRSPTKSRTRRRRRRTWPACAPGWEGTRAIAWNCGRSSWWPPPTSRLEGGRLLFLDNDRWQLTGGVRLISGANEVRGGERDAAGGRGAGRRGHPANHASDHEHFSFRQHFPSPQPNRSQHRFKMKNCKAIVAALLLGVSPAVWAAVHQRGHQLSGANQHSARLSPPSPTRPSPDRARTRKCTWR